MPPEFLAPIKEREMDSMKMFRVLQPVALAACALLMAYGDLRAQANPISITVGPNDQAATYEPSSYRVHLLGTAGTNRRSLWSSQAMAEDLGATQALQAGSLPSPGFYPADVTNPTNGAVITSAESNPLYVDCTPSCWGSPVTFLTHLGKSKFIHVADQYVGATADNRYTVGAGGLVNYPIVTALADNDILQIVHAGASVFGAGYDHIYHVFLPKGADVCFTGTSRCYSPDHPSTFAFCAYHASVTFSDIGHVLFTVLPFQNVGGCSVAKPSPNGSLIDSTSSILSHELFEWRGDR
jgi:hypothetical protein